MVKFHLFAPRGIGSDSAASNVGHPKGPQHGYDQWIGMRFRQQKSRELGEFTSKKCDLISNQNSTLADQKWSFHHQKMWI